MGWSGFLIFPAPPNRIMSVKMVFRKLEQILVAPKYGDVSQRHLCNVPKIFCRRHFGFEIGEHEAKHELHGISEKIK